MLLFFEGYKIVLPITMKWLCRVSDTINNDKKLVLDARLIIMVPSLNLSLLTNTVVNFLQVC